MHACCLFVVMNLTSKTVMAADYAWFDPTVLALALVFVFLVVLGLRVFPNQVHHYDRLQEAHEHQTKNPNAVER